jgi:dolichyl-phosphate beta-glucosyltransferase
MPVSWGVVIPCYNEADRLELHRFDEILSAGGHLLFVDDGSHDQTSALISDWLTTRPDARLRRLAVNSGKAEAVRFGLNVLAAEEIPIVGFLDADLAAPPSELIRLVREIQMRPDIDVAMGARVRLLGTHIERNRSRHYQGRVFASIASLVLRLPVYDTQCGLKIFRNTSELRSALGSPFRSRWAFDVELLARLQRINPTLVDRTIEVPLREWRDVSGSSLSLRARARSVFDLLRMVVVRDATDTATPDRTDRNPS